MAINTRRLKQLTAGLLATSMMFPAVSVAQDEEDVITITARKKEETLQEAPISVSVVTSEAIDRLGLRDIQDISKTTAGLLFDNEFGRNSNRPVIRGQANILGDSGVSYFIDGVYISESIADYGLNNIERIEVIKGPQSALYGRNTYSGAINIITKRPGDEAGGRFKYDVSSYGRHDLSATIEGPLGDGIAASLSYRHYEFGGEFTNRFDGNKIGEEETDSYSGALFLNPSDRLAIDIRAYHGRTSDGQPALFATTASENNCFFDNGSLYGGDGRYFCGVVEPRQINSDWTVQAPDAGLDIDTTNLSLKAVYDISDTVTLTSITGYNTREERFVQEADYQPTAFQTAVFTPGGFPFAGFPIPPFTFGYVGTTVDFTFASFTEIDDFSQEVRLNFSGDNWDALAGLYYFDQSSGSRDIREVPANAAALAGASFGAAFAEQSALCAANPICDSIVPFFGPATPNSRDINNLDTQNFAVFGSVSWELSPQTELTIEGRYAEEEIDQVTFDFDEGDPLPAPVAVSATFTSFDPRITLDWNYADNHLLYGSYATGQKPGGFNGVTAILAGLPTFDEEEVSAFEIGSKNSYYDGQLTANVALFFNEVEGYQLTQNARAGANTTSATVNAGDAEIFGLELEMFAQPDSIEGLSLIANYAYTDSEFTSGRDQNQGVLNDVADDGLVNGSVGCELFADPNDPSSACLQNAFGSIKGKQIPRTAEHQLYLDANLERPMKNKPGWNWSVGADYSYESSKFSQVHNLAETGDTSIVNARIAFSNDKYSLQFYGRNLTDENSSPLVLRYADGADSFKRSFVGTRRRGTHIGAVFTADF